MEESEAKQLYEFDKELTGGIPIRQMIGNDIYKLRWNKKMNDENVNRKTFTKYCTNKKDCTHRLYCIDCTV